MSLFSTIQLASNSLQAQQIGLQVVGQNVANANTPGYSREQVVFTPAATSSDGRVLTGLGVQVQGIVQVVDMFLNNRLWSANADSSSSQTQQSSYQELEGALGALGDNSIDSQMNQFFGSISNVLNQPQDLSVRNLAVLQGKTFATSLNSLSTRIDQMRSDLDQKLNGDVSDANQLIQQVQQLNTRIVQIEAGNSANSQAVGLRDQRNQAINQLSQLIDIKVQSEPNGNTNIYCGGDYLVFEGQSRQLSTVPSTDRGVAVSQVVITGTGAPLAIKSGEIAGLTAARDNVLGDFHDQLDHFAGTLAFEFNKIYSSGQGTTGFSSLVSDSAVTDNNAPLEAAGLPFTPTNGSFDVQLYNVQTGQTQTTTIPIVLNGLNNNDTTLAGLAQSLNSITGLSASITPSGNLSISSNSPNTTFTFGNDTSGTLAALGLNTFFTGSTAGTLGVSQQLVKDPSKFAASQSGVGGDTANAVLMAAFPDQPLDSLNGGSITDLNDQLTAGVTQGSAQTAATASGFASYQATLQGAQLATSGVSIDEETVQMLSFQRVYQASAKIISTINDLLDTLVHM